MQVLAPVQLRQILLHGLSEFEFVDDIGQRGVRRQLLGHVQPDLFRTHDLNLYRKLRLAATMFEHLSGSGASMSVILDWHSLCGLTECRSRSF